MGGSPNLTPVTGFKFETTMAQKFSNSADFLKSLDANVDTLRGSAYTTTIDIAKYDDTIKKVCKFEKDGNQYKVTIQTSYGALTAYSKTNNPSVVAIVECPVDTPYDYVDKVSGDRKIGTTQAGKRKVVFY